MTLLRIRRVCVTFSLYWQLQASTLESKWMLDCNFRRLYQLHYFLCLWYYVPCDRSFPFQEVLPNLYKQDSASLEMEESCLHWPTTPQSRLRRVYSENFVQYTVYNVYCLYLYIYEKKEIFSWKEFWPNVEKFRADDIALFFGLFHVWICICLSIPWAFPRYLVANHRPYLCLITWVWACL